MIRFVIVAAILWTAVTGAWADATDDYSALLRDHVTDGRVDYRGLCDDSRLQRYLEQLSATDPAVLPGDDARMAFWINVYNAFTLKIICDHYPVKSITELHFGGRVIGFLLKKTVWHKKFITINGEKLNLDTVEHKILRKQFDEPRIHFAIVCASVSCPSLRAEAYRADGLDEQLEDQARIFFADPGKNTFDVEQETAHLSKILDWFGGDFGDSDAERLIYISRFLPPKLSDALRRDTAAWTIKYTHYDWDLNE